MFVTKGSIGKIKYLKKLLEKNGLQVVETICPEFIITVRDPKPHIPPDYMKLLSVERLDSNWRQIVKDFDCIKNLIDAPQEFDVDTPVKILNGEFKDFTGIVVRNGNRTCDVEISVWGKCVKSTIKHSDLEAYENPFRS